MENFIYEYFITPIWDRTGYNLVNTLVYAAIAIIAIYFIHRWMKKQVVVDEKFIAGVLTFVLFGSTMRVVTDSIDTGVFKDISVFHRFVLESHLWDYGYITVTPGIYIFTAMLLIATIILLSKIRKLGYLPAVGLLLWLPNFLLLVPFMQYWIYAIPIVALAVVPTYICLGVLKKERAYCAMMAGQALDGAATFFVIDFFSKISGITYFEQHVLSSAIGQIAGTYFLFYLIKCLVAYYAIGTIEREKLDIQDKYYITLVIMIMGFAPGIRDILRMAIGG